MPRLHCPLPLRTGERVALPPVAARHVQVLRLQPGGALTLFSGEGGEFDATVTRMGRSDVEVEVGAHHAVEREAAHAVHLAIGMPANDRMDWLVEKATELGAASIQPLVCERSVLRLAGERAQKKQAHWQAVAVAACEQCGRNRVPLVRAVGSLDTWLVEEANNATRARLLLSPETGAPSLVTAVAASTDAAASIVCLSGPEGGLSPREADAARSAGFVPASLGPRVLRAETAPLAALMGLLATLPA